jgi:hypothetical protein
LKTGWDIGEPCQGIAWLETVAIRVGILMLKTLGKDVEGNNFLVYTDNTTTEAVLRSRKSRDHHSNKEWKAIQDLLIESQLDITPRRVVSKENAADGLLRGMIAPHLPVDRVILSIPTDLRVFMYQE